MLEQLNELSEYLNKLYGYVNEPGENYGEPAINSGPCGAFANAFYHIWNRKFTEKVNISFIMVKNSDECWHVVIRLPNGLLFDGGYGIHDETKYSNRYDIVDMMEYDIVLLEKNSYGLSRTYPSYCPDFSLEVVIDMIEDSLSQLFIK